MVFCDIIRIVFTTWGPVDIKLSLSHSVRDPVESHIDRFQSFVLHRSIDESDRRRVVDLHWSWWLGMFKFFEGDSHCACFSRILIGRCNFRFHRT